MLELIFPKDANALGSVFGGYILSLMDKAAAIAAVRHAKNIAVTARMEAIDFHTPIRVGDAVALLAKVVSVGRSSMRIQVEVHIEHLASGEQQLATSGTFIFVAVDANGHSVPVPPLATPTEPKPCE